MTIVVSVQCSEGIVLAADSAVAISTSEERYVKLWTHAKKVSHVRDYNVGTLSWGLGALGYRTIQSLIYEFEVSPEYQPKPEQITRVGDKEIVNYRVEELANQLFEFLSAKYWEIFDTDGYQPALGMLVAGYSHDSFEAEQYRFEIPKNDHPERVNFNGKKVGLFYEGLRDAADRLILGASDELALALSVANLTEQQVDSVRGVLYDYYDSPKEGTKRRAKIDRLVDSISHRVPFQSFEAWRQVADIEVVHEGMPLQDGIDLAIWIISTTIGRWRFGESKLLAGGEIDVAVITHADYTWIKRKNWHN